MNARYVGETYSKRTKPGVAEAATSIYATREAPSACLDLSYDACQLLGSDGPVDDVAVQHGAPPLRQHAGEKVFATGHDITDAAVGLTKAIPAHTPELPRRRAAVTPSHPPNAPRIPGWSYTLFVGVVAIISSRCLRGERSEGKRGARAGPGMDVHHIRWDSRGGATAARGGARRGRRMDKIAHWWWWWWWRWWW